MSETTLTKLLEYLYGTLTPRNMRWLAMHLIEQADAEELKPYTKEELNAMIDESERQIASGLCQDSDVVFDELDKELASAEQELNYAPAI